MLRDGKVEQIGSPESIYQRPRTAFVAEFLGGTNMLPGVAGGFDGQVSEVAAGGTTISVQGKVAGARRLGPAVDTSRGPAAGRPRTWPAAARQAGPARIPGPDTAAACGAARRHADPDLRAGCVAGRHGGRRGPDAGLRSGANHRVPGLMKGFRYVVSIGALALLSLFLLYPLALVPNASLRVDGTGPFTLANYAGIFNSGYYLKSVSNSLIAAACATVGATVIGVPLAFCMARVDLPGKAVLFTLASLPLVLPSFVAAYALVLLFGHAGVITTALREIGIPIGPIYGLPGIIAVLSFTLYPYVLMPTMAGLQGHRHLGGGGRAQHGRFALACVPHRAAAGE